MSKTKEYLAETSEMRLQKGRTCLSCGNQLEPVRDPITETFTGYMWTCPTCDPEHKLIISIG